MARNLLPLAVFLLLGLLLAVGLTLDPRYVPSPLIDKPAPEFTLVQLHDPEKTLSSTDLRGRVTLLNVWASWCVSCRQEHPLLLELARRGEVSIYGLNYKDRREDALRWLEFYGDPYLASVADVDGKMGIDLGVYGIPETFVLDQRGMIRYKHVGPLDEKELHEVILPLIRRLQGKAKV